MGQASRDLYPAHHTGKSSSRVLPPLSTESWSRISHARVVIVPDISAGDRFRGRQMDEMAHYLRGQGHQVSVVSQAPGLSRRGRSTLYEGAWFRREFRDGLRISRTWSYASPERRRLQPRLLTDSCSTTTALAGNPGRSPAGHYRGVFAPPVLGVNCHAGRQNLPVSLCLLGQRPRLRAARAYGFLPAGSLYGLGSLYETFC